MKTLLPVIALTFALAAWSAPQALAASDATTNSETGAAGTEGTSAADKSNDNGTPQKHHHHKKKCCKKKADASTNSDSGK